MLFTFFYMLATYIQAWRISALKARLCALFQGTNGVLPSIMLYSKPPSYKDNGSPTENGHEAVEKNLMSSHLCLNKSLAKLGDLLWIRDDTRLCTIYPQQKIDISEWLVYQHGETLFPLYTHNCYEVLSSKDRKMYVLIEVDLETYKPPSSTIGIKLEDYGLILTWTADKNLNLLLESDLDHITKLAVVVMEGQCSINNGLLLTRIESVLISGKPCIYDREQLSPLPNEKLAERAQWDAYVKKLRTLSSTARLVAQQNIPLEVSEMPGVVIFPKHKAFMLSDETSDDKHSPDSTVIPTPSQTPASATTIVEEPAFTLPQLAPNADPVVSSEETLLSTKNSSKSEDLEEKLETVDTDNKSCISSETSTNRVDSQTIVVGESQPMMKQVSPSPHIKPPNVLIYGDKSKTIDNIKILLENILGSDRYTIYSLSSEEAQSSSWMDQAVLVIVCGNIETAIKSQLLDYIIHGGKLLSMCSDTLYTILPIFKTAEICEQDIVRVSYGKWKRIPATHCVFCYEASSAKSKKKLTVSTSGDIKDKTGKSYSFDVKVLATEEMCSAPSILNVTIPSSGGKALFCQVHLEENSTEYKSNEAKYNILKQSDAARLEIFSDLLNTHLGMEVGNTSRVPVNYSPAFFLGKYELKMEMLETLKPNLQANDTLKMTKLNIQFCRTNTNVPTATSLFLPVLLHQCPSNFSTIEYFENLKTTDIGRLVIYADVLTSSMDVVTGQQLCHGLAVIPCQQTQGRGRSKNSWLSPKGCAMFTLQLHIPTDSILGSCIPIVQHLSTTAIVSAIRSLPGYQDIDIQLKWPNDIYAGNGSKLGGAIVHTQIDSSFIISNIGIGVNLSNSVPTCCINDLITAYNKTYKTKLQMLSYERYFALVFNEIERLLAIVQKGDMDYFYDIYYKYWMHSGAEVTIISTNGKSEEVQIVGIDNFGFLKVKGRGGNTFSVHPDGNSFDPFKGLIAPK